MVRLYHEIKLLEGLATECRENTEKILYPACGGERKNMCDFCYEIRAVFHCPDHGIRHF